jgi:protein gp37
MSKIEWTDVTWNPVTGCDKVSQGCKNCYAEVMHRRLRGMFPEKYSQPFLGHIETHENELIRPTKWKKPRMVFVNSMSDLFHKDVPVEFIAQVFAIMFLADMHIYQVLTKQPERMRDVLKSPEFVFDLYRYCNIYLDKFIKPLEQEMYQYDEIKWMRPLKNVWLGVSCENQETADERIPYLLQTPAAVRFLSCEPLLGPIDLSKWIGYIRHHEQIPRERKINLPGSTEWGITNRQSRANLEGGKERMGSMEEENCHPEMQESTSGTLDSTNRISSNKSNVEQETNTLNSAPISLLSFQGTNSDRANNQSQEWDKVRQPPEKLRDSDILRADDPLHPSIKEGSKNYQSERGEESDGQIINDPNQTNSEKKIKGGATEVDCHGLQCGVQGNLKNMLKPTLESRFWLICGGESGMKARPSHPDWFRSLRDQCESADIPFFFKQHGTWMPSEENITSLKQIDDLPLRPKEARGVELINKDGVHNRRLLIDGVTEPLVRMFKMGKKHSGNFLDGVQHLNFPK